MPSSVFCKWDRISHSDSASRGRKMKKFWLKRGDSYMVSIFILVVWCCIAVCFYCINQEESLYNIVYRCADMRGMCWNTTSLVLFSGQSVGPDLWAYVQRGELLVAWSSFSVRECQSIQFSPGMRTNAKIFLSQIEFLFSDQLVACIRCLMSVCSWKNRCTMGKYVWHKPDGLIFVFMEIIIKKYISWLCKMASFPLASSTYL